MSQRDAFASKERTELTREVYIFIKANVTYRVNLSQLSVGNLVETDSQGHVLPLC